MAAGWYQCRMSCDANADAEHTAQRVTLAEGIPLILTAKSSF